MLQVALQAEREQDSNVHSDVSGQRVPRPGSETRESLAEPTGGDRGSHEDEQEGHGEGLAMGGEMPQGLIDARLDQGQGQHRALLDDRVKPEALVSPIGPGRESEVPHGSIDGRLDQGHGQHRALPDDQVEPDALVPPTVWPSFTLQAGAGTINIETQTDSQNSGVDRPDMSLPAAMFASISEEENQRELAFAIAAGNVTPPQQNVEDGSGCGAETSVVNNDGGMQVDEMDHSQGSEAHEHEGLGDGGQSAKEAPAARSTESANEASAARSTEGSARNESSSGPRQLDLKHWLL